MRELDERIRDHGAVGCLTGAPAPGTPTSRARRAARERVRAADGLAGVAGAGPSAAARARPTGGRPTGRTSAHWPSRWPVIPPPVPGALRRPVPEGPVSRCPVPPAVRISRSGRPAAPPRTRPRVRRRP
ncbi:hypothetical protein BG618_04144 [Pseudonocardia autotrophica]|nr:hypothetical protein BG618_04144 [Pseudonocardia autotrophica]